jgi:hypothetical protein
MVSVEHDVGWLPQLLQSMRATVLSGYAVPWHSRQDVVVAWRWMV